MFGCRGDKNPMYGRREDKIDVWKGEAAGYYALHDWVIKQLPKPDACSICHEIKKLELCNISKKYDPSTYTRSPENWFFACGKCHLESDGRIKNLDLGRTSEVHLGKEASTETRLKLSKSKSGEKNPMHGKKHSIETRLKMTQGWKRRKSMNM